MLVLRRKEQQGITITNRRTGETIRVVVVKNSSDGTSIGVEASDDYRIVRSELLSEPVSADGHGCSADTLSDESESSILPARSGGRGA